MEEKTYFTPGMLVTLKLNIPNKPIMMVDRKKSLTIHEDGNKILQGMVCRWFTTDGYIQEAVFNTKDLTTI